MLAELWKRKGKILPGLFKKIVHERKRDIVGRTVKKEKGKHCHAGLGKKIVHKRKRDIVGRTVEKEKG